MGNSQQQPPRFEIRSPSGELLCTVAIFGAFASQRMNGKPQHSAELPNKHHSRTNPSSHQPPKGQNQQNRQGNVAPSGNRGQVAQPRPENGSMTEAQKRFLFRLLADQGIEGEEAHTRLKTFFQVASLKEVRKQEASQGIERLLDEARRAQK